MPRAKNAGKAVYKAEYQGQLKRGEEKGQLERQKARGALDKAGVNRAGKDIDHKTKIADGGKSTPGNLRLRSPAANRADNKHKPREKK